MELYKRIKQLSKEVAGSEAKLAAILGLRQNQFNGYLNPVSQRNLWEHLPAILAAFPAVARDWLYFGEGEMLKSDAPAPIKPDAMPAVAENLQDELARLRAELDEERKLNRKLVTKLFVDGTGDKDESTNTVGKTADGQG